MTIYDSDFSHELQAMEASESLQKPAVVDQVAEVSPVTNEEPEAVQQSEMVADTVVNEPSDKELNFRALRDSVAELKAERETERLRYQQELDSLRNQMHQAPKQEPKSALDDQSDDDLLTVGKYRQTVREMQEKHQLELERIRINQDEMKVQVKYPDYDEIMEKYSIPLLKNNRDFANALHSSQNKAQFAYDLGKKEMLLQQYQNQVQQTPEPAEMQPNQRAQRIVDNARKPGTLSSARGGQPSLSKADYWASCSEADFQKEMAKNLAEV